MASGIKDKVAILGMGCARFGERWDTDADQLMVEAYARGVGGRGHRNRSHRGRVVGVAFDAVNIGPSGIPASMALRLTKSP